ncbi:MAG: dihydrolipoyl dehydrogenase [Clostridiales Family XIII bacterium]|jgi:dihydrolipoamide dehydrogenase|nr:dihydrolipoyl dehydrogenase [Clostridiales Family XIII bacterium]
MNHFDLIIIGGGPAGYLAAERAAEGGFSVALFERRSLGGVCLNEGCIPTKSLLYSAKLYSGALHGEAYGVRAEGISIDHAQVIKRKNEVISMLVSGVRYALKSKKVTVVEAAAEITGKSADGFTVKAIRSDEAASGAEDIYTADRLLIATGSSVIVPPIRGMAEGIKSGLVVTSREILDIPKVPKKLIVVGGGVIGLEMADYFATVGSEVVVIEMLDKIAGPFDAELSANLQKNMEAKGVVFRLGGGVTEITASGVVVGTESIEADTVLVSIGRRPATERAGIESIGVHTEKGAVVTDAHMCTNIPGVYAAGDVNGKLMLAHTAYREAEVAVNHMLGKADHMRYDAIPSVIYTYPEVASVGETAETAAEKGLRVRVKTLPMNYAGRYVAENEKGNGLCKLIVDESANRVVGVQLIGNYASEIILSAGIMTDLGLPVGTLKELVFPHPTVGEIIRETLFAE